MLAEGDKIRQGERTCYAITCLFTVALPPRHPASPFFPSTKPAQAGRRACCAYYL